MVKKWTDHCQWHCIEKTPQKPILHGKILQSQILDNSYKWLEISWVQLMSHWKNTNGHRNGVLMYTILPLLKISMVSKLYSYKRTVIFLLFLRQSVTFFSGIWLHITGKAMELRWVNSKTAIWKGRHTYLIFLTLKKPVVICIIYVTKAYNPYPVESKGGET